MILYHASPSLRILRRYYETFGEPLNVLLSVAYNEREFSGFLFDYRHMIKNFIADSGAWSVAHGKSDLKIESVISFYRMFGHMFGMYFNFDVNFSTDGFDDNITNQLIMEKEGLSPIPVIHNIINYEIDYYLESERYDWLALGSSQINSFNDLEHAVNRIKKWENPNIKIHWFGGSRYEWLIDVPVASCDTTSWAAIGSFGYINYWNNEWDDSYKLNKIYVGGRIRDKSDEDKKREFTFTQYPWKKDLEEYLFKTFGLTYGDLCGHQDKENMQLVNIHYFTELERRINEERIKRGVPLE